MTRQRYSREESINRILRSLEGVTIPSDAPETLSGEKLSVDEALSDLAELLEGSLPNQSGTIPSGITAPVASLPSSSTTAKGIIETATNAEAVTGTDTARAVTPAGVLASIVANVASDVEYGGIYNQATGTAEFNLSTNFIKITGSFTGDMISTDNITPDYANDKITINHAGSYFVGMQLSFHGLASAVINGAIFIDGVVQDQIRFRRKLGTGGDVGSASAMGLITITGTPVDLDFRAKADAGTPAFGLEAGQVWIYGVPAN